MDDLCECGEYRCGELGGKLVAQIRTMGLLGRYYAIEDPFGAVMSLFEPSRD
ncbi:MAG: hypothetical protein IIA50_06560 [Bacteroidetes bacterium]|nr:hypothetical protein [Bacteroidota bacterium]